MQGPWCDGLACFVAIAVAFPLLAGSFGVIAAEPWSLLGNIDACLDLVWACGQLFCCEQLFRDQTSGIVQLQRSGLRDPARIDRQLLVSAIAVLISDLQGYAVSLAGERRRVDDADPSAAVGALCFQSRRQATAEQALVLTD